MAWAGRCITRSMPFRSATGSACWTASLDDRPQVLGPQVERHEARIELGHLEQVGGQPVEALDLAAALLQELVPGGRVVRGAVQQQLVEGPQSGDGRAQLVARHRPRTRGCGRGPALMMSMDSWRRSAISLNEPGQLRELRRSERLDGNAHVQPAFGERPRGVGQPAHRTGQPLGQQHGRDDGCSKRRDRRADHDVDQRGHRLLPEREGPRQRHRHLPDGCRSRVLGVVHVRHVEHGRRPTGPRGSDRPRPRPRPGAPPGCTPAWAPRVTRRWSRSRPRAPRSGSGS